MHMTQPPVRQMSMNVAVCHMHMVQPRAHSPCLLQMRIDRRPQQLNVHLLAAVVRVDLSLWCVCIESVFVVREMSLNDIVRSEIVCHHCAHVSLSLCDRNNWTKHTSRDWHGWVVFVFVGGINGCIRTSKK